MMQDGIRNCRSCGAERLHPIFSLGRMPLANALIAPAQLSDSEPRYPLDLVLCRACGLVQITETVPPRILFAHYPYFSSMAQTTLDHVERLVRRNISELGLTSSNLVVEVASNDGYLLQYYLAAGIPVLGIEPAREPAEFAIRERGVPTIESFFTPAVARQLKQAGKTADVIHAHNVLAHVPAPRRLIAGFAELLAPDGTVIVEVPYVRDLIEKHEFDTVYHEHYSYFSLTSLLPIFSSGGLEIKDVERIAVHGGSLRLFAGHEGRCSPSARVSELLAEEEEWGAREEQFYAGFAQGVASLRETLLDTIERYRAAGKRIAAYGASAKGCILLNYLGAGADLIEFVVDRAPGKQGHYIPGVRIPIRSVEALLQEMPDFALLLAWNVADEVLAQQEGYRARGGRFIIPLPQLTIV